MINLLTKQLRPKRTEDMLGSPIQTDYLLAVNIKPFCTMPSLCDAFCTGY